MGCESAAASACSSSTAASPNGKRSREPEDEVYLDNFHSHKRYLSEMMASSLNGLTVGDSMAENLMESPARSESICYPRDEITSQYSPMSEDSDDSRYCDTPSNTSILQPETTSCPTSPVSPHRHQRLSLAGPSAATCPSYPLPSSTLAAVACSHPRQRGSDSEGVRFPSSPNDVCHTADLRRAALLRSVQMRAHPSCSPAYELPFSGGQEGEDKPYSCIKTMDDDEVGYRSPEREVDYIESCSESKLGEE